MPARSLWQGVLPPESFELSQAQRSVLLGSTPDVALSQRAATALAKLRDDFGHQVWESGTVVERQDDELWWWTFAGGRGNATLATALERVVDVEGKPENHRLRLRADTEPAALRAALDELGDGELPAPAVAEEAVAELKFGEILPPELAAGTLAIRLADTIAARRASSGPIRWTRAGPPPS